MRNKKKLIQFLKNKFLPTFEKYKKEYTAIIRQNPDYEKASTTALKAAGLSLIPVLGPAILAFEDALKEEQQDREISSIKEALTKLTEGDIREIGESTGVGSSFLEDIKKFHSTVSERNKNDVLDTMRIFRSELRNEHKELEKRIERVREMLQEKEEQVEPMPMDKYEEMCSQKKYIENVLKNAASGVVSVDTEQKITTCNPRAQKMLNLDEYPNLTGKDIRKLPSPLGDLLFETLTQGTLYERKEVYVPAIKRWLSVNTSQVRNAKGEVSGSMIIFTDLTPIKYLEAEKKKIWEKRLWKEFIKEKGTP